VKNYERAAWLIMTVWFVLCLATLDYNGPFFDEGIYVTAGQRTLEGHGYTDGYLVWFAGSLLWPVLAAIGYKIAGLIGTRFVASLLAAVAFAAVVGAAGNLFGEKASFWTALALAPSAPFLSLARLGVYDLPALAGIAVSFWAVTRMAKSDNRAWLVVATLAFVVGFFGKYPVGIMALSLIGVTSALRGRRAIMDMAIFGLVSLAITLAFYLPGREQLSQTLGWSIANKPTFDVTLATIAAAIVYLSSAPFILALIGWLVAKDKRVLATVLLLSLAIWPAYHLATANPSSLDKHLTFGFLFAYPLIGLALATMWERWQDKAVTLASVSALVILGYFQVDYYYDRAWPDVRQTADYLVGQVQPGQMLLINESWPYTMYLYIDGRINSPWDVFDAFRITQGESKIDLCQYDWFVDSGGSYKWPDSILKKVQACGSFQPVFSNASTVVGLGPDLKYVTYQVYTTVWRNTSSQALSSRKTAQ
jgi:4-amino-4-deoxy-L-arabinose transferase-like glycosyltransferase